MCYVWDREDFLRKVEFELYLEVLLFFSGEKMVQNFRVK